MSRVVLSGRTYLQRVQVVVVEALAHQRVRRNHTNVFTSSTCRTKNSTQCHNNVAAAAAVSGVGGYPGRVLSVHRGLASIELSARRDQTVAMGAGDGVAIGRRVNFGALDL